MVLLNFSVSDFRRKVPKKGSDKKNLCNLIRAFRLVKTMLLKKKTPKIINKIKVIIMYGKKFEIVSKAEVKNGKSAPDFTNCPTTCGITKVNSAMITIIENVNKMNG